MDASDAPQNGMNATKVDVIFTMQEPYMQQIASGEKTFEFRRYLINESVKRIWFYRIAPHSSIEYVCEIAPARRRGEGHPPLPEEGLGNAEYNRRDKDYESYDYAYEILSVYKIEAIPLALLKSRYGLRSAPRGLMYAPDLILSTVEWRDGEKLR